MITRRKIIKGNTKLGWRIRDEYLTRREEKRRGGYYKVKDKISRLTDTELRKLINRVVGDS